MEHSRGVGGSNGAIHTNQSLNLGKKDKNKSTDTDVLHIYICIHVCMYACMYIYIYM